MMSRTNPNSLFPRDFPNKRHSIRTQPNNPAPSIQPAFTWCILHLFFTVQKLRFNKRPHFLRHAFKIRKTIIYTAL
jgi:hypothetical protein